MLCEAPQTPLEGRESRDDEAPAPAPPRLSEDILVQAGGMSGAGGGVNLPAEPAGDRMRPSLRNFPKKLGEKFFSVAPERPLFTVIFLRLRCAPYDLSSKPFPAI